MPDTAFSNSKETPKNRPDKKIFDYGCFLLARRRYSVSEFRRKLEKKFPNQLENTTAIVELFMGKKYLDDEEYVTLYIREQLRRKPQGLRLIKQKLRQKGISESTLSGIFREHLIDEDELISKALSKKTKNLKTTDARQKKEKLFRFLASRGFSHDAILKALEKHDRGEQVYPDSHASSAD